MIDTLYRKSLYAFAVTQFLFTVNLQSTVFNTLIAMNDTNEPLKIRILPEDAIKQSDSQRLYNIQWDKEIPKQITNLNIPERGNIPKYAVPYAQIFKMVLKKAKSKWGKIKVGPVIPYVDVEGKTVAYMFHFRIDGKSFPRNYVQVAKEGLADILNNKYRYGHFLVSSRYDRTPILQFGEGLTEFYLTGWKARKCAEEILGISNPKLKRIYYTWPIAWFEFEGKRKRVVIHSHLFTQWTNIKEFITKIRKEEYEARQKLITEAQRNGKDLRTIELELYKKSRQEWDEMFR